MSLDIVICPGCASRLPQKNKGCEECGYEWHKGCEIPTIAEIMRASDGLMLNSISPYFIRAVVDAATAEYSSSIVISKQLHDFGGLTIYQPVYFDPIVFTLREGRATFSEARALEDVKALERISGVKAAINQKLVAFDGVFSNQQPKEK